MSSSETEQPFSGRRRSRKTRRAVRLADLLARIGIAIGGIGTIVAVSLVCAFLVWVVIPLFLPGNITLVSDTPAEALEGSQVAPFYLAPDEYARVCWAALDDGTIRTFRLDTGALIETRVLSADRKLAAASFSQGQGDVALAWEDNSIQLGTIRFTSSFLEPTEVPDRLEEIPAGRIEILDDGILERIPGGQFRIQKLTIELEEPVPVKTDSRIILIDESISAKGTFFAALATDGQLRIARVTKKKNLLTGKVTSRLQEGVVSVELPNDGQLPNRLLLSGLGDSVFLLWDDGRLVRYDTRNTARPVFAESLDVVDGAGVRVTSVEFLTGKTSLAIGDSLGRIRVWFTIKPPEATTPDGAVLVRGHELPAGPPEDVVALASSARSRQLAAAYANGEVRLFHVTSSNLVARSQVSGLDGPLRVLALSPKDDALVAYGGGKLLMWAVDAPHPETTLASTFGRVWYEGHVDPQHVWQSSSGTDDFEEKFGLMPLVFGTLKATFYSMLFGVPLALLAAVYTSEFLHARVKSKVKPTIEMMAGLPSVVLGFLAALVFAPLVEDIVPQCLTSFFTVPFAFALGAYLWQLLPANVAVKAARWKLLAMALSLPLGIWLAIFLGPAVERWLFAGDMKAWLDGQIGSGAGAWMFLLLPLSAVFGAGLVNRIVTPWLRNRAGQLNRPSFALLDLGKFLAAAAATLLIAYAGSLLLSAAGWDPRGSVVGTYVQRNALVVGFIMGFAIIPIIYTISDDALSAVPESLRAASLGAGATPWQTAIRIVVPTALSGLFSAMMVGLGRAVGETMIVLMAAGNTPLMDWNIFNGFRTLSANIAVELPEAVINSTHYRMLYVAALLLFAITFLVNTVAEVVRMRFRKRAFQL